MIKINIRFFAMVLLMLVGVNIIVTAYLYKKINKNITYINNSEAIRSDIEKERGEFIGNGNKILSNFSGEKLLDIEERNVEDLMSEAALIYNKVEKGEIKDIRDCNRYKVKNLIDNCIYALALKKGELSICDNLQDKELRYICRDQIKETIKGGEDLRGCSIFFDQEDIYACVNNWLNSQDKYTKEVCSTLESFVINNDLAESIKGEVVDCWNRYVIGPYSNNCFIPSVVLSSGEMKKIKDKCK